MVKEKRMVSGFEVQCFRKDGSVIWTSLSARAVLGSWPFLNSRFCVMLAAQLERIKGHEDIDSGEERDNTGSRGDGLLSGWAHPLA
jgi:hypothetical protein